MIDTTFDRSTKGWWKRISTLYVALIFAVGCTTTHVHMSPQKSNSEVRLSSEALSGNRLGYVTGESGGFIWSSCENRVKMSLDELSENARAKGAKAVGEIVWDATESSTPGCTRKWLYLILWPIALTPMFMNTRVVGMAYKGTKTAETESSAEKLVSKSSAASSSASH